MLVPKDQIKNRLANLSVYEKGELIYDINKEHYEYKPVSIREFWESEFYLGKSFMKHGKTILYDYWVKKMETLYPSPFVQPFNEVLLEAPFGSGKSFVSLLSLAYEIHRTHAYKSPVDYFKLGLGTMILFVIFSLDLNVVNINWNYLRSWLECSPYFLAFYNPSKAKKMPDNSVLLDPNKSLYLGVGSQTQHSISRAIRAFVLDESNFFRIKGMDFKNYEELSTRVKSRFPDGDAINWIISSALSDGSFMDTIKSLSKGIKTTYAIDCPPQWIIKGRENFAKDEFEVFAGDLMRDAFLVTDETKAQVTPDMSLLSVPMNFLPEFQKQLIGSLRNLANYKNSSKARFFKYKNKLAQTFNTPNRIVHPYTKQPIEIIYLDEKDRSDTLIKYFETNIEYFKNPMNRQCLRFVHFDIGRTHDKFGIACSYADYVNKEFYRSPEAISYDSKRYYYTDWFLTIKAKSGQQIPYYKIHDLFLWLRDICDYQIELITTDQREGGAKLRQDLNISGFNVDYLSVDTSRTPWEVVFDMVYEENVLAPKSQLALLEASNLLDDGTKIDHPSHFDNGQEGSKDLADSWVGSLYLASKATKIFDFNRVLQQIPQTQNAVNALAHKTRVQSASKSFFTNYYG